MVMADEVYEPLNRQLDILYNKYGKRALTTKATLKTLMGQQHLHRIKGRDYKATDLQVAYAWDYLEIEYAPKQYVPREYEIEEEIIGRRPHVIRDKRTGRFIKWLS